jgi:hypothetical protein
MNPNPYESPRETSEGEPSRPTDRLAWYWRALRCVCFFVAGLAVYMGIRAIQAYFGEHFVAERAGADIGSAILVGLALAGGEFMDISGYDRLRWVWRLLASVVLMIAAIIAVFLILGKPSRPLWDEGMLLRHLCVAGLFCIGVLLTIAFQSGHPWEANGKE